MRIALGNLIKNWEKINKYLKEILEKMLEIWKNFWNILSNIFEWFWKIKLKILVFYKNLEQNFP